MKKIVCITLILVLVLSVNVNASSIKLTTDEEMHELLLEQAMNQTDVSKDEYKVLKELKKMSDKELKNIDLNKEKLEKYEKEMLKEMKRRSKSTMAELKGLGYSDEEAKLIKEISERDTLESISTRGLLATCFTYNTVGLHTYTSGDTYFKVYVGWSWDKSPAAVLNDTVGVGWDDTFTFNNNVSSSYNKMNVNYTDGYGYYDTDVYSMLENEIRTSKTEFPMSKWDGPYSPQVNPWAKSGSATVYLSSPDKIQVAKLSFKYGHNWIGGSIGLSAPFGVGFSFTGEETIYAPDEIAISSKSF